MFASLKLYANQSIKFNDLVKTLVDYNYTPCDAVSQEGDFSKRGGIVDIFPVTFENPLRIELADQKIDSIRSFDIVSGATLDSHTLAIILPRHIIKGARRKRASVDYGHQLAIDNFVDIQPNELVVHVNHGIGRFLGIKKIRTDKVYLDSIGNYITPDHMLIEYAEGDRLYVPVKDLHLVSRYISFQGRPPRLSKLGTNSWLSLKRRTKKGISSLAAELLRIQAARSAQEGYRFSPDNDWQRLLEDSFAYHQTPDQAKTTRELKSDMESARPMDRLICGDVGYGKTEVALRAAFKAVMDNKQVAMLVPTTILAEQHHYTFTQRLKDFPVNVQMLSRFKSVQQQQQILAGIKSGTVDIVIGTHRLLSADIKFRDLGLVIIDEEQRFGVKHKEKLKQLRLLADVLTLTATPIPRTLYMSLMGARDMSIINTPPEGRVPIETVVCEHNEGLIRKGIIRELNRNGQCYFVHNRVKDIERVRKRIEQAVPEANIAHAHGQMHENELEEAMLGFIQGRIDVLVATAIVQSGIDIPRANTLFVDRADLFGLADLYQLRGRVGRFKYKAYAFFLLPRGYVWTEDARRRLEAVQKHTRLGSGFKIAMEDLQIRGAGNLLGAQQHGWIQAVGFDLYCRLLRESIYELSKND